MIALACAFMTLAWLTCIFFRPLLLCSLAKCILLRVSYVCDWGFLISCLCFLDLAICAQKSTALKAPRTRLLVHYIKGTKNNRVSLIKAYLLGYRHPKGKIHILVFKKIIMSGQREKTINSPRLGSYLIHL